MDSGRESLVIPSQETASQGVKHQRVLCVYSYLWQSSSSFITVTITRSGDSPFNSDFHKLLWNSHLVSSTSISSMTRASSMESRQMVPSSPILWSSGVHSWPTTPGGLFDTGAADADISFEDKPASADPGLEDNGDDLLDLFGGLPECDTITEDNHHPGNTHTYPPTIKPSPPDVAEWMSDSLLMELLSTDSTSAGDVKAQNFAEALATSLIHPEANSSIQPSDPTVAVTHTSTQNTVPYPATSALNDDHSYCTHSPKRMKMEPPLTSPADTHASLSVGLAGTKTAKYEERRKKNNVSSKRSRDSRKAREADMETLAVQLETENEALQEKADMLEQEIHSMKQKLIVRLAGHQ